jgi:hypothetical protein
MKKDQTTKTKKKLEVKRTKVRRLDEKELEGAVGGIVPVHIGDGI